MRERNLASNRKRRTDPWLSAFPRTTPAEAGVHAVRVLSRLMPAFAGMAVVAAKTSSSLRGKIEMGVGRVQAVSVIAPIPASGAGQALTFPRGWGNGTEVFQILHSREWPCRPALATGGWLRRVDYTVRGIGG